MVALSATVNAKPKNSGPHGFNINNPEQLLSALEAGVKVIKLSKTITFNCDNSEINVEGSGNQKIQVRGDFTALEFVNCSTVNVSGLKFKGGNSPEKYNLDTNTMVGGNALLIRNQSDEDITVNLSDIEVKHFGDHGIYITDCNDIDCGDGNSGDGNGTDGSIEVNLDNVVVREGGFGGQDADGIRVNERGEGDIIFKAVNIALLGYGADGVELDEAGEGNVVAKVNRASFEYNGEYCALPGIGAVGKCDDEGDPDVDDAFDIDEADGGSIIAKIKNVYMVKNFDEGLDFDEEGEGGIKLKAKNIVAWDNADEAIKASEEDEGNTIVKIVNFQDIREAEEGKSPNQDLQVEQEDGGYMFWKIVNSTLDDLKPTSEFDNDEATIDLVKISGSTFDKVKLYDDEDLECVGGDLSAEDISINSSTFDEIEDSPDGCPNP